MSIETSTTLLPVAGCGNGRLAAPFDGRTLDVGIEPDPLSGSFQWFHFRVRADAGATIRIVNAGASSYPRGWDDGLVWARPAGRSWKPFRIDHADGVVSFPHIASGSVAYALFPPYPQARLAKLTSRVNADVHGRVAPADIGSGRALRFDIGDEHPSARQVWIVCGQHGNEHPAVWFAEGLVDALLGRTAFPPRLCFHIVPVANPGGMRNGHLRTNPQGQDPNRHWGGDGPAGCREVGTLLRAMTRTGVDMLLDVHTDFEMRYVYLDVLDEWMGTPEPLSRRREAFETGLAQRSADMAAGRRYPWSAPPRPELLAGMCAPAVERRFGAAAITLELPIGAYRDARDTPGTWSPRHSLALGAAAANLLLELS